MVEGFWIVQFAGMEGKGGGVVVVTKGKVFGGDSVTCPPKTVWMSVIIHGVEGVMLMVLVLGAVTGLLG